MGQCITMSDVAAIPRRLKLPKKALYTYGARFDVAQIVVQTTELKQTMNILSMNDKFEGTNNGYHITVHVSENQASGPLYNNTIQ